MALYYISEKIEIKMNLKPFSCRLVRIVLIVGGCAAFIAGLVIDTIGDTDRLYSLIGLIVFLLFGWIFSKHPSNVWH